MDGSSEIHFKLELVKLVESGCIHRKDVFLFFFCEILESDFDTRFPRLIKFSQSVLEAGSMMQFDESLMKFSAPGRPWFTAPSPSSALQSFHGKDFG